MENLNLRRGTRVRALRDLDPEGADVKTGMEGVVFEETNAYHDNNGPMAAFIGAGQLNIYPGDVEWRGAFGGDWRRE